MTKIHFHNFNILDTLPNECPYVIESLVSQMMSDWKRSEAVCKSLVTSPCLGQHSNTSLQLDRFNLVV